MKPLLLFDIESTGLDLTTDKIITLAMIKVTKEEVVKRDWIVNPGIPIPKESSDVHGITDVDVAEEPEFKVYAEDVKDFMIGCDIAGFNSNFYDIPLLTRELVDAGVDINFIQMALFIDVGVIFKRMEERTLSAASLFYLGKEHTDAHGAMADTEVTLEVFKEMRKRYPEIKSMSRAELDLFCNYDNSRADLGNKFYIDEDRDYCFNFSKHKGQKCKTEPGMLEWMLTKDFHPDTLRICRELLYS